MAKTVRRAKAKKLHGASHRHYAFYAGTAIRQGLLLSWHHQPNHCSFYRPLHHHHHHHHHYDHHYTQHIPTMTDSHHGGFLSVMIMVGICQVTNSHHK